MSSEVIDRDVRQRRRTAWFAVFVFLCGVTLILFLVNFTVTTPSPVGQEVEEPVPIEIELTAGGGGGSSGSQPEKQPVSDPNPQQTPPTQAVHTDESSDTPVNNGSSNTPNDNTPPKPQGQFTFPGGGFAGNGNGDGNGGANGDGDGLGNGPGVGVGAWGEGRVAYKVPDFDWPSASGKVSVEVIFNPDGSVSRIGKVTSDIADPDLRAKCIAHVKRHAKASASDGSGLQSYTYHIIIKAG